MVLTMSHNSKCTKMPLAKCPKMYETDGDKRVRNSVDFQIKSEIKTM